MNEDSNEAVLLFSIKSVKRKTCLTFSDSLFSSFALSDFGDAGALVLSLPFTISFLLSGDRDLCFFCNKNTCHKIVSTNITLTNNTFIYK